MSRDELTNTRVTLDYLKSILHYNPETGIWTWLKVSSKFSKIKIGSTAGGITEAGYIRIRINAIKYMAHVLAWFYMTGKWPENDVDHEDLNRANNKWINLREATVSQNNSNKNKLITNKSGFKGVSWDKDALKWRAQISVNNTKLNLGRFDNIEDAVTAYNNAALKYFNDFARTKC